MCKKLIKYLFLSVFTYIHWMLMKFSALISYIHSNSKRASEKRNYNSGAVIVRNALPIVTLWSRREIIIKTKERHLYSCDSLDFGGHLEVPLITHIQDIC